MSAADGLLYDLDAARSPEQRAYMEDLERRRVCIFCPEHVAEYHDRPVEHRGEHWYITQNAYPYAGTVAHYLIVPHRHVTSFDELPDAAGAELWALQRLLKERHAPRATASVQRSGDMRFNGGSVAVLQFYRIDRAAHERNVERLRAAAADPAG